MWSVDVYDLQGNLFCYYTTRSKQEADQVMSGFDKSQQARTIITRV